MSDASPPDHAGSAGADAQQTISRVIDSLKDTPGALLPILHGIQAQLGYIPSQAVAPIARALRRTRAEVHGVISFYHDFRRQPPGQHRLSICCAEACQARGARALEQHVKQTLGIDYHQTSADRLFSLAPVYCLGNCACGPSVRVDSGDDWRILGRVDAERFDRLLVQLTTVAVEIRE